MNYHNITKCDCSNGSGVRVVLWVSGCIHACDECHNKQTWSKDSGILFDDKAAEEIFDCLSKEEYTGITFSGGDPLHIDNREVILELAGFIKSYFSTKNIWLYTGYTWEEIKDLDGIQHIDVLVDGTYKKELSNPSPKWKGSTNQRVIDVKETLETGEISLYEK